MVVPETSTEIHGFHGQVKRPTPEVGTVPCLLPRSWEFIEYHHLWCGDQRLRERQPGSSLKFGHFEKGKGWQYFGLGVM